MGSPEPRASMGTAQRISIFPALSWTHLRRAPDPLPFPLDAPDSSLWYNARAALWQGLKALGLEPGQRILVPAYACGSEIDVMVAFGLTLDWYPVTPTLEVDLDRLASLCRTGTRALFVIHYFGFSQPLDDILSFVRDRGLLLIEDTAHGLYSRDAAGRALGSRGDLSIFSLYKTLALPDGGALFTRTAIDGVRPEARYGPALRSRIGRLRLLAERSAGHRYSVTTSLFSRHVSGPLSRALKADAANAPGAASSTVPAAAVMEGQRFDQRRGEWGMSGIARWMLDRVASGAIASRRRANYLRFESQLVAGPRVRPLFARLPEGCCPLMFPLLQLQDGRAMRSWLTRHGIECHGFGFDNPAIPMDQFQLEASLKAHVACLPIHQDLNPSQVDYMASAVNRWTQSR